MSLLLLFNQPGDGTTLPPEVEDRVDGDVWYTEARRRHLEQQNAMVIARVIAIVVASEGACR